jgi:hypothetical protein
LELGGDYNIEFNHDMLDDIYESVYFRMTNGEIRCFLPACGICSSLISSGGKYPDNDNTLIIQYDFALDYTLNVSDIEAVIFNKIEIPVN